MSQLPKLFSFGMTVAATVLIPTTNHAATFPYDQVTLFSTRPIDSNDVLSFFGDLSNNEGYTLVNNVDPNAPDSGHMSIAQNALPGFSDYYTMGREASPDPNTVGERSATLEDITGFSNFFNYIQTNNINFNDIGFGYGQKAGLEFTRSLNLGEDQLGQDWFATPDSPIEQRIYRTNPDDYTIFVSLENNPIVTLGYSPTYFAVDNGETPDFIDNFNVFLSDPTPAFKVDGLNGLESGLADAFLEDVNAVGGLVQFVSEDILKPDQVQVSFVEIASETYNITYVGFPITLRAVSSVPEPSSSLGLILLAGGGIAFGLQRKRLSQ